MNNACLMLIDLQNDYFPGGNMELAGMEEAAANAQRLLNRFRETGSPVLHVQHLSIRPGATFFLPGTTGAAFHQTVAPQNDEVVIVKNYPNSFRDTPLFEALKETKSRHLVICGAMTHMCIDATARAAFDLGFTCTISHDACATRDLTFQKQTVKAVQVHAAFLAALSGIYAGVVSTEEIRKKILS